jgi:hypothetical protein
MKNPANALLRAASLCVVLYASNLMASTVQVGNCKALPTFPTIQTAVNSVPAGSTVFVCPGTYAEQINIGKNLSLKGVTAASPSDGSGAIIKSPAGGLAANTTSLSSGNPIAAHVLVHNAMVTFTNLTIDSSNNGISCTPNLIGLFYRNASGTISNSAFFNQIMDANDGCQGGLSIFVQSGSGGSSVVKITSNTVQDYQKNGITGNETGTDVTIMGNTVVGRGPTNGAANNGIQIGFGATGSIVKNTAIDDIWSPDTISDPSDAATGILVFASSNITVRSNTVGNTQFGIGIGTDGSNHANGNSITMNQISATRIFDGIDICGNNNTVHNNTIRGSDEAGIHIDSSCDDGGPTGQSNSIAQNKINSACVGILVGTSAGSNTIGTNMFFNAGTAVLNGDQCLPSPSSITAQASQAKAQRAEGRVQFHPARP